MLVPARIDSSLAADGMPDGGYYDAGSPLLSVTCPSNISGYTFSAGVAVPSGVTMLNGDVYHSFECSYTGSGGIGTVFDGTVNDGIQITNIINPAPKSDHVVGTADMYRILIQHLNSADAVIDSTPVAVGLIESVRVTASVAPQLTFRVEGQPSSTNVCGSVQSVNTTATTVPFGELFIDNFKRATQKLTVTTNAVGGYTVTARMNDQLGRSGAACVGVNGSGLEASCIQDASVGSMSNTVSADWTTPTNQRGFGYSLHNDSAFPAQNVEFFYNEGGDTFRARHFSDVADGETSQRIFHSTTIADTQSVNVCYRVAISASQAAGNYENFLTYTATATF